MSHPQTQAFEEHQMDIARELEPLNAIIQVCPNCGKVDVYKDDGHTCDPEWQAERELNQEYYD